MPKINTAHKSIRVNARITELENDMFNAIQETEGLSVSETVRFLIRSMARIYGYLPAVDCPDCHSQQVEPTADDLMVCSECGQEFGK